MPKILEQNGRKYAYDSRLNTLMTNWKSRKNYQGNWIDLRAAEDVALKAGEFKLIPLGIAMELPRGYEAHVVPRSSTFKNYGIIQVNHQGVVDGPDRETGEGGYCGNDDQWFMPVYAITRYGDSFQRQNLSV